MNFSTEAIIRLAGFAGVFAFTAVRDVPAPRRPLTVGKSPGWLSNRGLNRWSAANRLATVGADRTAVHDGTAFQCGRFMGEMA